MPIEQQKRVSIMWEISKFVILGILFSIRWREADIVNNTPYILNELNTFIYVFIMVKFVINGIGLFYAMYDDKYTKINVIIEISTSIFGLIYFHSYFPLIADYFLTDKYTKINEITKITEISTKIFGFIYFNDYLPLIAKPFQAVLRIEIIIALMYIIILFLKELYKLVEKLIIPITITITILLIILCAIIFF